MERWNLVCGPTEYLSKTATTLFFCGNLFGVLICGWAADRFGRKPCILISSMLCIVGCIVGAYAPNIIIWMVARFLVGGSTLTMNTSVRVFMAESTNVENRPFVAAINNLFCQVYTIVPYKIVNSPKLFRTSLKISG